MKGRAVFLVLALALAHGAWADLAPESACGRAGHAAELAAALPADLLVAIGIVESGRADPGTGAVAPWPWTVNVDGTGQYFATKEQAEAFVRLAQASGAGDIDVGCFQISLLHHPDAFASLDDAFDPDRNAAYAAQFLGRLKAETGSWNTAVADYHSAAPELGLPYQRRVLAVWHGETSGLAPLDAGFLARPDPVVIMQSPAARRVRVYTMDQPPATTARPGLPRIITP